MADPTPPFTMSVVTDPTEVAAAQRFREQADRNADWLQAHADEVFPNYRGKFICIAGQELFAADTAQEALALAKTAHPDDDGFYLRYIYKEKRDRI